MTIAGKFIEIARNPIVTGLGTGALAAGLTAYSSAANEDFRNEGDQRILSKVLSAGLLAGLGSGGMRYLMQKNAAPVLEQGVQMASKYMPEMTKTAKEMYASSPIAQKIPVASIAEALGVSAAASVLGGIGSNTLGNTISDAVGIAQNTGAPIGGSWTKRANEWNWDKQIAEQAMVNEYQAAVNDQVLARLNMLPMQG